MRPYYCGCFLLLLLLSSCIRTYTLSEKEKNIIVYKGTESLIFISDKQEQDTIKLDGFDEDFSTVSSGLKKSNVEHYDLMCLFPYTQDKDTHFTRTFLISLTARENGKTAIGFNILNDKRKYYFHNSIYVDSLYNIQTDSLDLNNKLLIDIVAFTNKNEDHDTTNISNLSKIYWSFSKGLVGYQLKNGENWKLARIIIPRPAALNKKTATQRNGSYQKKLFPSNTHLH
jgi:hypothetical protein